MFSLCIYIRKFCHLILRKVIKIVASRCQILRLKCTKLFDACRGSAPNPAGRAYTSHSWILGPTSKRGKERGGEEEGGKAREGGLSPGSLGDRSYWIERYRTTVWALHLQVCGAAEVRTAVVLNRKPHSSRSKQYVVQLNMAGRQLRQLDGV